MDEREILAKNIADLRIKAGLTQLAFAEKLNYSDKAVSKWERGESIPDIFILKRIATLFGVSVDYLLEEKHNASSPSLPDIERKRRTRRIITLIATVGVWILSVIYFAIHSAILDDVAIKPWMSFIYAIPLSLIVALVFNSIWGARGFNYLIITLLIYGVILSLHLTILLTLGYNMWYLYLIGIPSVIVVVLTSRLNRLNRGGKANE